MLEEAEARQLILDCVISANPVFVPLSSAFDRISARRLVADLALPGFDNSQMDGYAVTAAEAQSGAELSVSNEQPAGPDRRLKLRSGEAIRIFTGAPMPNGADAVVMQEDVELLAENRIKIRESVKSGEFIRRKGADLCPGQVILEPGERLTPAKLSVLASQGLTEAFVNPMPRCSIVTTGDELVPPGKSLEPGSIFNSNGPMLEALVRQFGGESRVFHAPDDPPKLRAVLQDALSESDFCFVAGGVSVGDHDHVKGELEALGVAGGFWRVRIKPGKPLFFGQKDHRLIFGLPGNPVSAYLTFLLFAVSALKKWQGFDVTAEEPALPSFKATLSSPVKNDRGNRPHYVRGNLDLVSRTFDPIGIQQSYALFALSRTNALVRVEPETALESGEEARCFQFA